MVEMGNELKTVNKDLVRHMTINALRSYKMKFQKYGELVIACDSGQYWRREYFPYYKYSRKEQREKSNIDWQTIFDVMNELRYDIDKYFPYKILRVDGAEADDIIGALVIWLQTNQLQKEGLFEEPQHVMIVSGDKDFAQLQRWPNVKQYSPRFKKFINPKYVLDTLQEHIIRGDAGDGIPNILSADDVFVRKERQKSVMTEMLNKWVTDINTLPENLKKNYDRNRTLIDLTQIPYDLQEAIILEYNNQPTKDRSNLISYFTKHNMMNMLDVVSHF